MKFAIPVVTFLIFALALTSTAQSSSIENEVLAGLDDIYNLRFDQAERKFIEVQRKYPQQLSGFFYESLLYFYRALPSRQEDQYNKFLELSANVIKRADKILDNDERNFDAMYFKGLSHSYRSLLMLTLNKDLLEAASDGNKGYRTLSALIKMKPEYYDAYMGLGLYKIALGFVPDKFKWLLSLIGFEGDLRSGVDMLNTSMAKGKFTRVDSKVFLSVFSLKERELDDGKSMEMSKQLVLDYPESPVFKVFHASLLLQGGNPEDAIRVSEEALKQNDRSFQDQIVKAASAVMGTAYFRLNDYMKAAQYLQQHFVYAHPEDRYNVHMFTLGICYELTGDRKTAVETYKKVRPDFIDERDGELDKFFYRYAKERIAAPLRQYDKDLITAMNYRETNRVDQAISMYEDMLVKREHLKSGTVDDRIRLFHNLGLSYHYVKQYDKATDYFQRCLPLKPETEKWLVPHSYFELGKIYSEKGDRKKAVEMFEKTHDYDDFDFESFLEMRIANYRSK